MHTPIRLDTVADLITHEHSLRLYCRRCDRWAHAPLEKLVSRGLGDRAIRTLRFRCVHCGDPAVRQLRPPELPPASGTGWMEPARGTP